MTRQYSIAEARARLPSIVHEVEQGGPVELTRRGKAVAVLVSASEYRRVAAAKPSFGDALKLFLAEHQRDIEEANFTEEEFASWRDRSPGRDWQWPD